MWRPMRPGDLAAVCAIADAVHVDYPEDADVIAEKLSLYPAGCAVMDLDGGAAGYLIAHPWVAGDPPRLNHRLGALPAAPDLFYWHDIALSPAGRGKGAGRAAVAWVSERARRAGCGTIALMSVGDAAPFWRAQGFVPVADATANYGPGTMMMRRAV